MNPTPEQALIIDAAGHTGDNILINALAGTGKTSTLELIHGVLTKAPILYLAFNKRVVEEMEKRLEARLSTNPRLPAMAIRTFNSLGHRIWAKANAKNLKVDPKKINNIFKSLVSQAPKDVQSTFWEVYWDVVHAVRLGKALGYIPEGKYTHVRALLSRTDFHRSLEERPDALTAALIDAVLAESIRLAYTGLIDFDDQVYMPGVFGGTFPRFPIVAVDEVQDLSPVNHAMLDKLVKSGTRLFAVGDRWQSIYEFRGAKAGSMEEAQTKYSMTSLDLSVSFRCPQAIVEAARWRVPNFKWSKPGGTYDILPRLEGTDIPEHSTILCRNNSPLFRMAFNLLSRGRSVSVAGSDIGPKLIGHMRKLGPEELSRSSTLSAINDWEHEKLSRESSSASDMAACMRVFANQASSLGLAISYAEHLFKQTGSIKLMTGHKAKGLEWDTVYHLDPHLCKNTEQDKNLRYVIGTRSREFLYEINSENIQWA